MTFLKSLRDILVSSVSSLRLWLFEIVGVALMLAVWFGWLHINDKYWWQLLFSGIVAVVIGLLAIIVSAGALDYTLDLARDKATASAVGAVRRALWHLLSFLLWAVLGLVCWAVVLWITDYKHSFPGWLRSELPAWLRRIISEPAIDSAYNLLMEFLFWVLAPAIMLPLGALCADKGFRGFISFRLWFRMARSLATWFVLIVAALLGIYCTDKLLDWKLSEKASLFAEESWLGIRLIVVYLLKVFAWLLVCSALARARLRAEAAPVTATPAPAASPAGTVKKEESSKPATEPAKA